MRGLTKAGISLAALTLTACGTGNYYPLREMTADQIKAATSAKEASATCITGTYAGAKATTVWINADRGVPAGVTMDENCKTTFDNKPAPPAAVPLQGVPRSV